MSVAVKPPRVDWTEVVDQAAAIVSSYSTGVTLRQLFYRLVAAEVLPNTTSAYKSLSSKTAEARREYGFPSLVDRTRSIHQLWYSEDPAEALEDMASRYRLDRTEGQDVAVYIGVEKNGIVNQLERWFQRLGIPIIALGGYASQTYRRAAATAPTWSCGGSTAASTKRRSGRSPRPAKANATESPPSPPGSWGRSAAYVARLRPRVDRPLPGHGPARVPGPDP